MEDRELFETYRNDVYYLCYYMMRNRSDAEDICQETFVQALRTDRSRITGIKPWLMRIAANLCKNELSRRKRKNLKEAAAYWLNRTRQETPEEAVERSEEENEMIGLFALLPVKIRIVASLRYVNGLTLQEIAEIVGIPEGTVKSRLNRVHTILKRKLGTTTYVQLKGEKCYEP
ncbi:RNA polymerase sigma factor [Paenibacillus sp. GYB003]|uniref:RNA polymerase sigma factor n=1 Tax=Paenibacillus sp. GYB003 TaxID=2994392 RepID=UPI002F96DCB9